MRNKIGDKLDGDGKRDSLGDSMSTPGGHDCMDKDPQSHLVSSSVTSNGSSYSINGILGMRDALSGLSRKRTSGIAFGMCDLTKNDLFNDQKKLIFLHYESLI